MEEKFIENFKEILEITERDLHLTDNFREFEEWDSMAALSVIAMIDEEYDIVFSASEFKQLRTLGDLVNEIRRRKE